MACSSAKAPAFSAHRGGPVTFSYVGPDGTINEASLRGRVSVLAFVTTYNIGSQLALRRLAEAVKGAKHRVNAVAVVLEPPRYAALLNTFKSTLGLPYPVVLADYATLHGRGAFGALDILPTLVFLDADGRITRRLTGTPETPLLRQEMEGARK